MPFAFADARNESFDAVVAAAVAPSEVDGVVSSTNQFAAVSLSATFVIPESIVSSAIAGTVIPSTRTTIANDARRARRTVARMGPSSRGSGGRRRPGGDGEQRRNRPTP